MFTAIFMTMTRLMKCCINTCMQQVLTQGNSLVNVHKDGYPVRPVVSMLDTVEYKLAKWLDTFIKLNIPNIYMLNSTNEFVEKISTFPIYPGDRMASFDVNSLYTNIPLKETIVIITNFLYSKKSVSRPPFPKAIFKKLLTMVAEGMFYAMVIYINKWMELLWFPFLNNLQRIFLGSFGGEQEVQ